MNLHKNSVQSLPYSDHCNPSSLNHFALLIVVVISPSRLDLPGGHGLGEGQNPEPSWVTSSDVADVVLTDLCGSLFLLLLAAFDHFETLHIADHFALWTFPAREFRSCVSVCGGVGVLVLESQCSTPLLMATSLLNLLVLTYKWLRRGILLNP